MIEIKIPGKSEKIISPEHLVLDYNGTLAVDGIPIPGVRERLERLAGRLSVHVVTADTFGKVREGLAGCPCEIVVLPSGNQVEAKAEYVAALGFSKTIAVGNGANDRLMLEKSILGIALIQAEGAFPRTVLAADVVCTGITDALDILLEPARLSATLRT